jgi:hypothetical protein
MVRGWWRSLRLLWWCRRLDTEPGTTARDEGRRLRLRLSFRRWWWSHSTRIPKRSERERRTQILFTFLFFAFALGLASLRTGLGSLFFALAVFLFLLSAVRAGVAGVVHGVNGDVVSCGGDLGLLEVVDEDLTGLFGDEGLWVAMVGRTTLEDVLELCDSVL